MELYIEKMRRHSNHHFLNNRDVLNSQFTRYRAMRKKRKVNEVLLIVMFFLYLFISFSQLAIKILIPFRLFHQPSINSEQIICLIFWTIAFQSLSRQFGQFGRNQLFWDLGR